MPTKVEKISDDFQKTIDFTSLKCYNDSRKTKRKFALWQQVWRFSLNLVFYENCQGYRNYILIYQLNLAKIKEK